ncbi:MAG: hypothetical protein WBP25_00285, partial [Giesbergeria sp.]
MRPIYESAASMHAWRGGSAVHNCITLGMRSFQSPIATGSAGGSVQQGLSAAGDAMDRFSIAARQINAIR